MARANGFLEEKRDPPPKRPVGERVNDWREIYQHWPQAKVRKQAARCMGCGVPFCHTGCPLGNLIPEWTQLVHDGQWRRALDVLHATNNFPEFTGRICPAPCEESCVLAVNEEPVTIEHIEKEIADRGFNEGWIVPEPPAHRTGKRVAVVGSGPAGLAAAQQLNRAGHEVTVFERDRRLGGLLTLGIPDFKLEKHVVQRRIDLLRAEGIRFESGVFVGVDLTAPELERDFQAICLAGGCNYPRDPETPGTELAGVHYAMDYLIQQNRLLAGEDIPPSERITAAGKRVVILGGGDTAADCYGTAHRQGAREVHQFDLRPPPPELRRPDNPWPYWPRIMRTRTSFVHEEGGLRRFGILTKRICGQNGRVEQVQAARVEWVHGSQNGNQAMREVPGGELEIDAELVLIAVGFGAPKREGILEQLGVAFAPSGLVAVDRNMRTSAPGVYAAGDIVRGMSLVVWAIADGREAARGIDEFLMGSTELPRSSSTMRLAVGR